MRYPVHALVVLIWACVHTLEAQQIQELGPWKIGMTRAESESFKDYGPYSFSVNPHDPNMGFLEPSSRIKFLGESTSLSLQLGNGRIKRITVSLFSTEHELELAAIVFKAADYLSIKLGQPKPGAPIAQAELVKLARDARSKDGFSFFHFYEYKPSGHPYVSVLVFKDHHSSGTGKKRARDIYSVQLIIEDANSGGGPSATTTSQSAALADWSFEVPGGDAKFKRSLGSIHALLVRPLDGGGHAAQAMKLNVTAVPASKDGTLTFAFNQPIGEEMRRASEEVVRGIQDRHGKLPSKMNVRFGFEDKWGGKDGPSASVACALLLESLVCGFEIPQDVAVTGDMKADLSVQPVGGVGDKLRGAMDAGCFVVGIPAGNEEDLNDIVVEENLRRFLTAKVFLIQKLDDALVLADPALRGAEFSRALADFDGLQKELREKGAALLYAAATQQRLDTILKTLPNLHSAKILQLASLKKIPTTYSLAGSLVRIEQFMAPYVEAGRTLRAGKSMEKFRVKHDNPLLEARNQLTAMKLKSDPRLLELIQAQENVIQRTNRLIDPISTANVKELHEELRGASTRAQVEWKKLSTDPEIQDQLLKLGISFDTLN